MHLKYKEKYEIMCGEAQRYKKKYDLMYQWMKLKQKGIEMIEFFQDRKINSIAIYGVGDLARLVYKESGIAEIVKYGIDRQASAQLYDLDVHPLEEVQQKVEAILITPVLITDEIEDRIYDVLGEQTTFVFEEILYELSRKHRVLSELWPI